MIPMSESDEKWRAESDLRTLREAEEIKGDAARLARAQARAKEEQKALRKVVPSEPPDEDMQAQGYRRLS